MAIDPVAPRLPAGAEFSPGQISLKEVLSLAARHPGDRAALVEAIRARYFANAAERLVGDPVARLEQQTKRAGNVVIGMGTYGLYDRKTNELTDLGRRLHGLDETQMHQAFAAHILTDLSGVDVLEAVRSLKARGEAPTKLALVEDLRRRGFDLPKATGHHLTLLAWLEKGGVVRGRDREIDEAALRALVGASSGTVHEVLSLSPAHQAYLATVHALARGRADAELTVRHVDEVVTETYGEVLGPEDQQKAWIRDPLVDGGWIELAGTGGGRGGKSGVIRPTAKLLELDPDLLNRPRPTGLPASVLDRLDVPLGQVYDELRSDDKHIKGTALELLAANMAYDLGLVPVAFRLRAADATGGTEVDLLAEGVGLHFSRWVFQCKNTGSVDLKVATREIGVADIVHATVIVIVTTGRFTRDTPAVRAALARATEKQIVLVDGTTLKRYQESGPQALLAHFRKEAQMTMRTKREQALGVLEEFGPGPS